MALQQQVDLSSIYTTMQTFMGGYLVNYFNRFGRQWQTYVEAEGTSRTSIANLDQFYVRSQDHYFAQMHRYYHDRPQPNRYNNQIALPLADPPF